MRDQIIDANRRQHLAPEMSRRLLTCFFVEDSTRTRNFSAAAGRLLGMEVGSLSAAGSSLSKGETFPDTAVMLATCNDLVVLRHPEEGAVAEAAAAVDRIPSARGLIINGGD